MALMPLKAGEVSGGGFKEGNQGGRVTASTRRLQGAELGSKAVEGSQIQRRRGRAQVMQKEGDDRWGPPVS
jgi:hypothetical protein